jgi:hypothetical protein
MKPKVILCAVLALSGGLFGCSSTTKPVSRQATVSFEGLFAKVEQEIPELKSIGVRTNIPLAGRVWRGEEYATATFVFQNNVRYHPAGEFPRATAPVPYADIIVTICRYDSAEEEQKDLENTFRMRPATFGPKEIYKGAVLYRYQGASQGVVTAICQSGQYIVEISAASDPGPLYTMKVLDAILAVLPGTTGSGKNFGERPAELREAKALSGVSGPDKNFTEQISRALRECEKIKPGMTRAELEKVFTTQGGIWTATHRAYVYRGCRYIKVDVEFKLSVPEQDRLEARPTDTISKISKPYLEWGVID